MLEEDVRMHYIVDAIQNKWFAMFLSKLFPYFTAGRNEGFELTSHCHWVP